MAVKPIIRSYVALLIFMGAAFGIAFVGGIVTQTGLLDWYPTLNKSALNPPNAVFPLVWTLLFTLMGFAAWLAWKQMDEKRDLVRPALAIYFIQLIFNLSWSVAFFGFRSPLAGLIVIIPFVILVVELARRYHPISAAAYWMTIPYVSWVIFASYLNGVIWWLN